mmetsp:Transcript_146/g.351  ORF Transcript_146/g.351 Transcript_146/m.351 type:complete len:752 (-) Transcript_146:125-2380(-)
MEPSLTPSATTGKEEDGRKHGEESKEGNEAEEINNANSGIVGPTTPALVTSAASASTEETDRDDERGPSQNRKSETGGDPPPQFEQDSRPSMKNGPGDVVASHQTISASAASTLPSPAAVAAPTITSATASEAASAPPPAATATSSGASISPPTARSAMTPSAVATVAANASCPAEQRRGSGFLLLAAEAYEAAERTQLRADAIRRVAMELASAAVATTAAAAADPPSTGDVGGTAAAEIGTGGSLQRRYEDVMLEGSASSFLQGLAGGAQQQQQRRTSSSSPSYSSYSSAAAGDGRNTYPEMDGNFREQVYMAAARMQLQHHDQARVQRAQPQSHEADENSPHGEAQEGVRDNDCRKRKRPSMALSSVSSSKSAKAASTLCCVPPLPHAPLVPPASNDPSLKSRSSSSPKDPSDRGEVGPSNGGLLASGKPRPKPLKHVYHDYSSIPDSEHFVRKKTGGVTMAFPEKLMNMLDRESVLHPDAVSWLAHGRAFIVRKPKVFTSEVMGGYFRQSKLTSFQRQLNLYGFRRITQGADAGAYYHELFLRGRPQLSMRMQRQKVKGTGHKQPTDVTSEPNFYAMPSLFEIAERGGERGNIGGNSVIDNGGNIAAEDGGAHAPMAPPDGTLIPSRKSHRSSPSTSAPLLEMYNSPGLQAAAMLRRLSSSNAYPPPLSLGLSVVAASTSSSIPYQVTEDATSDSPGGFQTPCTSIGSCANAESAAAAAMTALGNGSDVSGRSSSSSVKGDVHKMEYV